MNITIQFDASVATCPNVPGFKADIIAAAQFLDHLITNNVNVTILVGWGEDDNGQYAIGSSLAIGGSLNGVNISYSSLRSNLTSAYQASGSAVDAAALNSLPIADPTNGGHFYISSAQAKAWGISVSGGADGAIGFNSSINWNYSSTDRSVPGKYDLFAAALHELTHALGRVANYPPESYNALDLFRFSSPGTIASSLEQVSYFSIDGGVTNLNNFDTKLDAGDWAQSVNSDSFGYGHVGQSLSLTPVDVAEINVLGFAVSKNFPVVTLQNVALSQGSTIAATSLIKSLSNPNSDQITAYNFFDYGTANGHFTLNGVAQTNGQWISVNATDLNKVGYVSGTAPGSETLLVAAYDATLGDWSVYSSLKATTTAAPVASNNPHVLPAGPATTVIALQDSSMDIYDPILVTHKTGGYSLVWSGAPLPHVGGISEFSSNGDILSVDPLLNPLASGEPFAATSLASGSIEVITPIATSSGGSVFNLWNITPTSPIPTTVSSSTFSTANTIVGTPAIVGLSSGGSAMAMNDSTTRQKALEFFTSTGVGGAIHNLGASNGGEVAIQALPNGNLVVGWDTGGYPGFSNPSILGDVADLGPLMIDVVDSHGSVLTSLTIQGPTYYSPSIAVSSNGNFAVASVSGTGGTAARFDTFQVFDSHGARLTGNNIVLPEQTHAQGAPSVSTLTNGDFVFAWEANDSIFTEVTDSSGNILVGANRISSLPTTNQLTNNANFPSSNPVSVAGLSDGSFAVSWAVQTLLGSNPLYGSSFSLQEERFNIQNIQILTGYADSLDLTVYELYQAAFARVPDAVGFQFRRVGLRRRIWDDFDRIRCASVALSLSAFITRAVFC